ncbi:MAG TPA: low molecular weight protein-tyrosine-phosphatase [Pseudomonadales bacterium]
MFNHILTVCVGNICRSPTAECLLHQQLASRGITVSSAGLGALVGKPMDATAHALLAEHGYEWQDHRARQLQPQHLHNADLILVMEHEHSQAILKMAPEARGKVFLLGKWLGDMDIPDPYRQSNAMYQHVYDLIQQATDGWLKKLG